MDLDQGTRSLNARAARGGQHPPEEDPEGFSAVWAAYPTHRRGDRAEALAAYRAAVGTDPGAATRILAAVSAAASSDPWLQDDGRYVPALAKYLSRRDYLNHQPPPPKVDTAAATLAARAERERATAEWRRLVQGVNISLSRRGKMPAAPVDPPPAAPVDPPPPPPANPAPRRA